MCGVRLGAAPRKTFPRTRFFAKASKSTFCQGHPDDFSIVQIVLQTMFCDMPLGLSRFCWIIGRFCWIMKVLATQNNPRTHGRAVMITKGIGVRRVRPGVSWRKTLA